MRTHISALGAWRRPITLVWWGVVVGTLSKVDDESWFKSWVLPTALSSFLAQVSRRYLWTQAQQPISDLQRVSSYSGLLAGPCDRWPSACQYCTIFQFPAQEEEFKGLSEVQRHSVVPPAHNQTPALCWRPEIQTFSSEHSRNQVLSVSTKQPLLPPSCLTDSKGKHNSLFPVWWERCFLYVACCSYSLQIWQVSKASDVKFLNKLYFWKKNSEMLLNIILFRALNSFNYECQIQINLKPYV